MAVISINKKQFEKEIGKIDSKMQKRIAMFGTPVEAVTDEEVQLEVFPNRPDLLSYQGFKRSFLAFIGKKTGLKQYKVNKPGKNYEVKIDKSVKQVRPFTACAIVKSLKFNDEKIKEIIDIQEKIHSTFGRNRKKIAIGIYPLEKIKLPIHYRAAEPEKIKFIPLESDKEMNGRQILQRHPAGRDYAHLLQGKEKFPYFIDSAKEILSMPPIINSQLTGKITEKTKDVFIECSGFDFEILKKTLNILVTALADMGGQIYSMKLKHSSKSKKSEITPNLKPEKIKINIDNINKLLGLNLKESEIKKLLAKMGYDYKSRQVYYPAYRTDILHEVDITEDIAIAYGYDKFVPEIPPVATIGQIDLIEIKKRKIAEILAGLGMLEISTYHLTNKQDMKKANIKSDKNTIQVEKSKTDYNTLRSCLLINSLKVLSENIDAEYPQKIFEIGKVFQSEENENKIKEKETLIIALVPGQFTKLKQTLDYLMRMLNVRYKIEETEHLSFINGRVGKIINNNKTSGTIGEISPSVLKNWHIKMPVAVFELNLEEVFESLEK